MYRISIILIIFIIVASCSENNPVPARYEFSNDTINSDLINYEVNDAFTDDSGTHTGKSRTRISEESTDYPRQYQENVGTLLALEAEAPIERHSSEKKEIIYKKETSFELPLNQAKTSKYISLNIDNDIFTNTDYYYTHGTSISFMGLGHRFYRFLPGLGYFANEIYGIALHQDLYTPINPEATDLLPNDRPFAGLLYLRFIKNSILPRNGMQLKSEWIMGMIGPSALGDKIQQSIHELEPTGWAYQIKDDLLINLNVAIEKQLLHKRFVEISGETGIRLGTLKTGISASAQFKAGNIGAANGVSPIFRRTETSGKGLYYYFFVSPSIHYILHDASLNGGIFMRNSPHVFSHSQIETIAGTIHTGFSVSYSVWELHADLTYISPAFKGGRDHKWGGIGITYFFD